MRFLICTLLIILSLPALAAGSVNFEVEPTQGKVEFLAKGWPSLLKINGKGEGVTGNLAMNENKVTGDIVFKLATLKTGISLRDNHMKNKYLHVEKFPEVKLHLKDLEVPKTLKGKVKFKGMLSLHGVEKEVTGTAKLKPGKKGVLKLNAQFKLKLSEYGIEIPSFQGITVAEEVTVKVKTDLQKAEAPKSETTMATTNSI